MSALDRVQVAPALPVFESWTYASGGLDLRRGHVVRVPFGPREVTAYVLGPGETGVEAHRLKEVRRLLDPEPAFDEAQLALFQWIARYYLAPLGEVIATALPAALRRHPRRVLHPTEAGLRHLATPRLVEDEAVIALREIVSRPGISPGGLARRLHAELEEAALKRALARLLREGLLREEVEEEAPPAGIATLRLRPGSAPPPRGARMRAVLERLEAAGGSLDLARLVEEQGPAVRAAVQRLEEQGHVLRGRREDRGPGVAAEGGGGARGEGSAGPPPVLRPAQEAAVQAVLESDGHQVFLLHGVTGSGKTEVYLRAAEGVRARGRQVLVLVPEISLTPQLTGRFQARFGEGVAVLHSGLSPAERHRQWRRIRAGEASVTVGARSALFAPFGRLGLLVVDEEHDDSYKQDEGVRYHARDVAVVRGRMAGCPVLLGSATPSAESWWNAAQGRYTMLRLPERAHQGALPRVELVDMRGRPPVEPLSDELRRALEQTLSAGGKAIVLYNRRGYAPAVECPGCGNAYTCPSCGVGLVLHRGRAPRLQCHHCGFSEPFQPDCPRCGTDLQVLGHGTARIEEALAEAFPEAGVLRMDADTTASRGSHARILEDFRQGRGRILVGTQMVAKGHDFPDVHLAAVVGIDHLLLLPDFRNAERVHALVTQLAGRAGRGERPGRVLVQTCQPEHHVLRRLAEEGPETPPTLELAPGFAVHPELDDFLLHELRQRQRLGHPPQGALVLLRLEGVELEAVLEAARGLVDALRAGPEAGLVRVQGPVSAPMSRLAGRWRVQIVLRGADRARLRRWLEARAPLLQRSPGRGLRLIVDVDPRHLM